jgi:hypothetical protein
MYFTTLKREEEDVKHTSRGFIWLSQMVSFEPAVL